MCLMRFKTLRIPAAGRLCVGRSDRNEFRRGWRKVKCLVLIFGFRHQASNEERLKPEIKTFTGELHKVPTHSRPGRQNRLIWQTSIREKRPR